MTDTYTPQETVERRLAGIRRLTAFLMDSSDDWVWVTAEAMEQLCTGTITVDQALAQAEGA